MVYPGSTYEILQVDAVERYVSRGYTVRASDPLTGLVTLERRKRFAWFPFLICGGIFYLAYYLVLKRDSRITISRSGLVHGERRSLWRLYRVLPANAQIALAVAVIVAVALLAVTA